MPTISEPPFCNLRVFVFSSSLFIPFFLRNHRDLRKITLFLCSIFVFVYIYSECVAKASGCHGPTFLQCAATCRATKFNFRPYYRLLIDCLIQQRTPRVQAMLRHAQSMIAIHWGMYCIYVLYGIQLWGTRYTITVLEGSLLLCTGLGSLGCTLLTLIWPVYCVYCVGW